MRERTVQKAFFSTKVMEVFLFKKAIAKAIGIQAPSFIVMTQGMGNLKAKLGSAAEWSLWYRLELGVLMRPERSKPLCVTQTTKIWSSLSAILENSGTPLRQVPGE